MQHKPTSHQAGQHQALLGRTRIHRQVHPAPCRCPCHPHCWGFQIPKFGYDVLRRSSLDNVIVYYTPCPVCKLVCLGLIMLLTFAIVLTSDMLHYASAVTAGSDRHATGECCSQGAMSQT